MGEHPKTVDEIFEDYRGRRGGLMRALTDGKRFLGGTSSALLDMQQKHTENIFPRSLGSYFDSNLLPESANDLNALRPASWMC